MKRICALVLGVVVALAGGMMAPGLASARPAANQQAIDYVLKRALTQRGVPYTYGGGDASGPSLGVEPTVTTAEADPLISAFGTTPVVVEPKPRIAGFDASGLIVYSFAGVGIKLPRSSGEQYKVGRKIPPSLALPGDLIFYGPEGTQSVALFLGNGQMLEATTPAVTVSPVRTNNMAPYLSRIIE